MGCRHTFTCTDCSLTWKVSGSGEIDYGKFAGRITLACASCLRVKDAAVDLLSQGMSRTTLADLPRLPVCAVCGSDQVRVWKDGDPCPSCSGPVLRDPNSALRWD